MNRRHFLTAGGIGTIMGAPLAMPAQPQSDPPFKMIEIDVSGNKIFCRHYGDGPAILMVHGFPRTSLMWRFLAPKLAVNHSVVCVDLRAYGRSGIPAAGEDHFAYSKRAMANELIEVMAKLGFSTFTLIGHDRGGRVAYRMALDRPKNVQHSLPGKNGHPSSFPGRES
jgi:haloacetate dehalogenase